MPFRSEDLPELGSPRLPKETNLLEQLLGDGWQWKRGVTYDGDTMDANIGSRAIKFKFSPDQILLDLILRYSGDTSLQAQMPLMGGNLQLNAGTANGNNRYGIQWGRNF